MSGSEKIHAECPICKCIYMIPTRTASRRKTCGRGECTSGLIRLHRAQGVLERQRAQGRPISLSAYRVVREYTRANSLPPDEPEGHTGE
jgi:hypothetical protein